MVLASVPVADALLKTDTPCGRVWPPLQRRRYGEHDDGSAYDGIGSGPLLTGERGHYELAAGRDPLSYLEAMIAMASPGGMLPEQVWDADPIPSRRLLPGRPTGRPARLLVAARTDRQLAHRLGSAARSGHSRDDRGARRWV
jgi:glucoamylase